MTICAETGCKDKTAGESKYCKTHRAESRKRFKAMLEAQRVEREARNEMFALIWAAAVEGGTKVATATGKPGKVIVRPGNCAFANFVVKHGYGTKSPADQGVVIKVDDREAGQAMAAEIRNHDIRCVAL